MAAIQQQLKEEDFTVTKRSLYRLLKKFKEKEVYTDLPRRARDKKLTPEMLTMINDNLPTKSYEVRDPFVSSLGL